jgi:hypothetical protein
MADVSPGGRGEGAAEMSGVRARGGKSSVGRGREDGERRDDGEKTITSSQITGSLSAETS